MNIKEEKSTMRKEALEMAKSADSETIDSLSREAFKHILNSCYFYESESIFIFISMGHEINTQLFIPELLKTKRVFVPYTPAKAPEMLMTEIFSMDELEPGAMGILNLKEELLEDRLRDQVDLVLAPSILFDDEGYRLGYGGGYYDRFLAKGCHKHVIGLGLSHQRVAKVPRDSFDIPVEGFIGDRGFENFTCKSCD